MGLKKVHLVDSNNKPIYEGDRKLEQEKLIPWKGYNFKTKEASINIKKPDWIN